MHIRLNDTVVDLKQIRCAAKQTRKGNEAHTKDDVYEIAIYLNCNEVIRVEYDHDKEARGKDFNELCEALNKQEATPKDFLSQLPLITPTKSVWATNEEKQ